MPTTSSSILGPIARRSNPKLVFPTRCESLILIFMQEPGFSLITRNSSRETSLAHRMFSRLLKHTLVTHFSVDFGVLSTQPGTAAAPFGLLMLRGPAVTL